MGCDLPARRLSPDGARDGARDRGFTLLEVLVAFLIAALALTALFNGALGGLQAARVASQYQEAITRARSHLAAVGQDGRIVAGDTQGDDGGDFHWHLRITQVAIAAPPAGGAIMVGQRATGTALFDVVVTISWKSGAGNTGGTQHAVSLDSQRLGQAARRTP